ncbi:MAG: right-handed parallel beta-helix repeat-containing protein [Oligoflexales bacterium]|nr:right-handed parallel beta-helix repeat-containing protein [Oligoflexales bacterium]
MHKKIFPKLRFSIIGFSLIFLTPVLHLEAATVFHVSPNGRQGATGSSSDPFADLASARTALRALPATAKIDGVTILLSDGLYAMPEGIRFDSSDSGTQGAPVVIAAEPSTHPTLLGGKLILKNQLEPIKDPALLARLGPAARESVRKVDLASLGIGRIEPFPDTFGENWRRLEVIHAGTTLPLSRWPNGEYGFTTMKQVIDNGGPESGGSFIYRGERPKGWLKALSDGGGIWLRGFWRVPWIINGVRVREIDTAKRTISLLRQVQGGIGSKYSKVSNGIRTGDGREQWWAINLPEEIDEPGEWAVDFNRQILLIWPPRGIDKHRPLVIAGNTSPVISLDDASHITIRGLTIRGSLASAVEIRGGQYNLIAGCVIGNTGNGGIVVRGGKHHRIVSNDISETGLSGVDVTGGDRQTLEPGEHEILNNDISRAANNFPVAALILSFGTGKNERSDTVGNRVAHNRIHDTANAGVYYGGNDNILELNEVYRVGLNSGDLGGFYTTGGFSSFGNIVRHNFIHHSMNANAIYLDDGDSGDLVTGNVTYRTAMGVLVGGGHYNRIEYNMIIDAPSAIHVDSRGVERNYTLNDKRLKGDLELLPYDRSPWKERYPDLAKLIAGGETTIPKGNRITGNFMIACETQIKLQGKPGSLSGVVQNGNITTDSMKDFADVKNFNFELKPGSRLLSSIPGFTPVPFKKIGLYPDEYRPVVPARDMKLLREGKTDRSKFNSSVDIDATNSRKGK